MSEARWCALVESGGNILYMTFKLQIMINYNAKVFDFVNIW